MSSIGTGYDLSAGQFSPDGRVFQIEYAQKAVENSGTVIGIRGKDSVVLAVEKLIQSKLYEPNVGTRLHNIDLHIGVAVAGFLTDSRSLIEYGRDEAAKYISNNGVRIPLKILAERLAAYIHAYTLYSAVRPFGSSIILASAENETGPQMYMIEPNGVYYGYTGIAIGKAKQAAKTEIEKLKLGDLSPEAMVIEAAKIIYSVHDESKDKNFELEMSWVRSDQEKHSLVPAEVRKQAEELAKKSLEDESSDED